MIFRTFHVDTDSITIDDTVVNRPIYISPMQWMDLWKTFDEFEGESVQDKIERAVIEEIHDVESEFEKKLDRAIEDADKAIREIIYKYEEDDHYTIPLTLLDQILKEVMYIEKEVCR